MMNYKSRKKSANQQKKQMNSQKTPYFEPKI